MIQMHLGGDLSAAFPPCYPIQAVSSFSIYFVEDPDCLFGCSKTLRWTPSPARARQSRARWPQCVEFIVNIRQASSTFSMAIVHVWPPRKCFHAHWNKIGFDRIWHGLAETKLWTWWSTTEASEERGNIVPRSLEKPSRSDFRQHLPRNFKNYIKWS